jgi:hypothetical protein
MWNVEYTDDFGEWWDGLDEGLQDAIDRSVGLLESVGPFVSRPHADTVRGSRHGNMKELRVQASGEPYRIFLRSIRGVRQFC